MELNCDVEMSDDLFHGAPSDIELLKPVLIAHEVLTFESVNSKQVNKISNTIEKLLEEWKIQFGDNSSSGLLELSASLPWSCAGEKINSLTDLFFMLYYEEYKPVLKLCDKYPINIVFSVVVLLQASLSSIQHNNSLRPSLQRL